MPSNHPYGPHRPEDAPNAVTVLGPGKWPAPEVRELPASLVRQREQVNELARLRDLERHSWPCICGLWHLHDELCPDGGWVV